MKINHIMFLGLLGMVSLMSSCTKEGPIGPAGANGKDGLDGKDANETCKQCHSALVVEAVATQFELSKHSYGEAAFEEAGNAGCAPCHEQEGFKYVCKNNTPATFTLNTTTGKYVNDYSATSSTAYGELSCFTCHSSLHTTYGAADLNTLTTTAAVPLTMYAGAKTVDLQQDGGKSNLCVKCHQPRPSTVSLGNGRIFPYDTLVSQPTMIFWDSAFTAVNKWIKPSYRMHNHYGAVGAIYAGKGGIEYPGASYTNVNHTTTASCIDCHMAPINGKAGGHSFVAKGNYTGCNVTGCHSAAPLSATSLKVINTKKATIALLNTLAGKINAWGNGKDLLHVDATEANLWATYNTDGNTTGATKLAKAWDGYLDMNDASTNPLGWWKFQTATYSVNPNQVFPKLTMLQFGAIINFQLCLREYSLGIHNNGYTTTLLTNTIQNLTNAGL